RLQGNDKHMLLKLIPLENITGKAERSIKYMKIKSFEDLHDAFSTHVTSPTMISAAIAQLAKIYQLQ
ncbi:unnamed protein product, partial [Heterotrigona itama]